MSGIMDVLIPQYPPPLPAVSLIYEDGRVVYRDGETVAPHGRRQLLTKVVKKPLDHCKRGHLYTAENTQMRPGGHRRCLECQRNLNAKRRATRKSLAKENPCV